MVRWLLFVVVAGCAAASSSPGTADDAGNDAGSRLCGNDRVDPGEDCDDGNDDDTDDCVACVAARCGDGAVHDGIEACDDGNTADNDLCATSCEGWQYRVAITFEAAAAGGATSVLVVLEPSTFSYAHAAATGSDLRFGTMDNGAFDVPYFIESWDAAGASFVWVRVPSLAAGTNTLHAFYGHSMGVATASDFAAAFPNTLRTTGSISLGGAISHDAVIVEAGHTVTVTPGAPLAITAALIRIDGTIDANNAGHAPAAGLGVGGNSTNAGAGGGGHGGAGGLGGRDSGDAPGAAGVANGDAMTAAIDLGSGGGGTDVSQGGRGGGAVNLRAQRIAVAGAITARGQAGAGSARSGGGGAGGGVLIHAHAIAFTGSIAVDGGPGGSGSASVNDGGGGGGGGRIKLLHAGRIVDTGAATLTGGAGGAFGDVANGQPGAAGTKHTGASTTLPLLPAIGAEQRL